MAETALIFDLDGTLIHSVPEIHAVANEVLAEEGLAGFSLPEVQGFVGNGLPVLVAQMLAGRGEAGAGARHARMVARFEALYESRFDLTTLYPGVPAMLAALSRHHALAICTNKPLGPTRAILARFDLAHFFPVVIGGDSLAVRKPDPAPLLAAWQQTGAGRAIFVGDSEVDAETAQRAALPFALFAGGYRKTAAEALGATWIFHDHARFPDLVAQGPQAV